MNIIALLFVAAGGAFALAWLIHYVPLHSKFLGKDYSPRLTLCRFLAPFDATLTFILVAGPIIGLGTAITGIGMMIYNVCLGLGISAGVVFTKKALVPAWTKQYKRLTSVSEEMF